MSRSSAESLPGSPFARSRSDDVLSKPVAAGGANLRRPHVRGLALADGGEDGDGAQLRVDDALVTEEGDERQDALRQLGAVEQHAEGAADVAEDLLDGVDDVVVVGGDVRLVGDRGDA